MATLTVSFRSLPSGGGTADPHGQRTSCNSHVYHFSCGGLAPQGPKSFREAGKASSRGEQAASGKQHIKVMSEGSGCLKEGDQATQACGTRESPPEACSGRAHQGTGDMKSLATAQGLGDHCDEKEAPAARQ